MPTTRPTTWRPPVEPLDLGVVMKTVQRLAPADTVYTNGAGNYSGWLHRYVRYYGLQHHGRTQLAPTSGAMGYGVPAAVAAALLYPQRTVVNVAGDGDFLMTGQELATATGYGAGRGAGKLVSIVVDNGSYGTIRMHQEREYPGRVSGSELFNPDFAALARGLRLARGARRRHRRIRVGLRRGIGGRPADADPHEARYRRHHHAHHAHGDPRDGAAPRRDLALSGSRGSSRARAGRSAAASAGR